jgi:hypothetical protein
VAGFAVGGQSGFQARVAVLFLWTVTVSGLISCEDVFKSRRSKEIRLVAVACLAVDEAALPGERWLFDGRAALRASVDRSFRIVLYPASQRARL